MSEFNYFPCQRILLEKKMKSKRFNGGLLVGIVMTLGVLTLVGAMTLRVKAAQLFSSSELDKSPISESASSDLSKSEDVSFHGTIEAINGDTYTINGLPFKVDAKTELDSGLMVGAKVEVDAILQADGTYLAKEISSELSDSSSSDMDEKESIEEDDSSSSSLESSSSESSEIESTETEESNSSHFNSSSSDSSQHESIGSDSGSQHEDDNLSGDSQETSMFVGLSNLA